MNSKLYVGNLSFSITEAELRDAFAQFGTITELNLVMDRYTGQPRGFAFVTFSTEEESKLAAETLGGVTMGGRQLTVNPAKPAENLAPGRQFTSPDRRAGAFYARGKRRG